MKILEAHWSPKGHLLVWGEDEARASIAGQAKETAKTGRVRPHPRAMPIQQLEKIFGDEPEIIADGARIVEMFLPTVADAPLATSSIGRNAAASEQADFELAPWSLPALLFKPLSALFFLTSLPSQLPAGVKLDHSMIYWLEAAKLLLELLCKGKFVPGIERQNGSFAARWLVLARSDEAKFSILADAMPALCRALIEPGANQESTALLESFIKAAGDALIRYFVRSERFVSSAPPATSKAAVSQAWLSALTSSDPLVRSPAHELSALEQRLRVWAGDFLAPLSHHTLKTAFRLNAPAAAQETWKLEFIVLSTTDRSKFVTAEDVWRGRHGFLQNTEHNSDDIEEMLLKDLGESSALYPAIRSALLTPFPTHVDLSIDQAYTFLRQGSVLLERSGFEVLLPDWWTNPSTKVGLHLSLKSPEAAPAKEAQASAALGFNTLLDFSWQVAIGSEKLSAEEFNSLVEEHSPLVNIHGQWIELQPARAASAIRFLEKQRGHQKLRLIDAIRLGLGLEGDETSMPVVGLSATGWVQRLIEGDYQQIPAAGQPAAFSGTLRPYQLDGLTWLNFLDQLGIGGCLADDMGLGKTIQFLALLLREREDRTAEAGPVLPTLIVVPMSILDNWRREAQRFAPALKVLMHHGTDRLSGEPFIEAAGRADIVLTTYSLVYRDEPLLSSTEFSRIALDEAQAIKNLNTKQTGAVRRLIQQQLERSHVRGCARVVLTGTPLENRLDELWSIFDFLNPGLLGSVGDFRSKFALPIERFRDQDAAQRLSRLVRPFILRRLKSDPKVISDLPEKIEIDIFTQLTPEQAAFYQTVLETMMPQVEKSSGIHRKGLVLTTITKLKQICNHPALYLKDKSSLADRSGKLTALEELLEVILAEGDKTLIFTQYAQMGELLKARLQERFNQEVLFLHGALQKSVRTRLVDAFQAPGGPQIFVLSLKAGGFGLNLTAANQVIHFDQWWNPAVQDQATDRAYRIGQQRNVQVRKFICKGTLEERIAAMLKDKRELAGIIVGATKNELTELSTEELRKLLELSAEDIQPEL